MTLHPKATATTTGPWSDPRFVVPKTRGHGRHARGVRLNLHAIVRFDQASKQASAKSRGGQNLQEGAEIYECFRLPDAAWVGSGAILRGFRMVLSLDFAAI